MTRVRSRLALWFVCIAVCAGQSVRLVPDIAVAEAEYRDAEEAWLRNDPNLEKELLNADPEQMKVRIRRAASLRDTAMVKKEAYLSILIERLQSTLGTMQRASSLAELPVDALRSDLEAQQARVLGDQERLEALMGDLPQGDEYFLVHRALEAEHADLVNLQNNIALRIRSLENAGKAQDAAKTALSNDSLAQKLQSILKIWEDERSSTVRQRTSWSQLYRTMEQTVDPKDRTGLEKAPMPPSLGSGLGGRADENQAKSTPLRPAGVGTTALSSGLAGVWVYRSERGAWSGYGEPEMVTLELNQDGRTLRGTYTARLPVRSGLHDIHLDVEGARETPTSARLRWKSQVPAAAGELEIRLASDGRLFLQRTRSDDSYIPKGMEVLLRQ